ncbi:MAG: MBL fold metallo-hydrolase [Spirosomataceae bacterium]
MITLLIIVGVVAIGGFVFMQQATFGQLPTGKRLERIQKSPQYKNGSFQNSSDTPVQTEDFTVWNMIKAYWNKPNGEPPAPIPFVKTNLKTLLYNQPTVVWFGHSSYLLQINGLRILADPVFSGSASPVPFTVKSYAGTDEYGVDDFPELDVVLISHDHFDHLDYETIVKLKDKTKRFVTSLGVGAHLERWGVEPSRITELDWYETTPLTTEMSLTATPARHFSGRSFTRGQSLWSSFVLKTPQHSIFLGGDSGYDTHFKSIGEQFGPFDLAILEAGQYNAYWKYIHMMPEETVQASLDLKAKVLLPVHWGKFTLALHTWNDPIRRVVSEANKQSVKVTTPMIGEPVLVDSLYPQQQWWQ